MTNKIDPFKTKFLLTALPDVAFDGWSDELMQRTAEKLKKPYPVDIADLVKYFSIWATDETLKKMQKAKISDMRVRDRITFGVKTRLEILAKHKEATQQALNFMMRPPYCLSIPKMTWYTADKIWWAAGDTSTDYNHYTKRTLLSGVLSSTTLYWLNDASKDHADTWAFLDRRIENVMQLGKAMAKMKPQRTGA